MVGFIYKNAFLYLVFSFYSTVVVKSVLVNLSSAHTID